MKQRTKYRIFEMIPGAMTWSTLILVVALSFLKPLWAIYLVILFDLYWLIRVLYFVFYLIISWRKYRTSLAIDWAQKLKKEFPAHEKYYHIIFFPFYTEPYEVLKHTFDELIKIKYDLKKVIIILGGEVRAGDSAKKIGERIEKEYKDYFHSFLFTLHPSDLPDEIKGKGANANFMGHESKRLIDRLKIPYEDLIVSYFDIDTITHPQYFACLTTTFLTVENPYRCSYQPVALYNNNIWQSNPITRVAAFGTTFWLFTELARPDRLYTFSSHSMSWKALVDVGFWQKDIVTDDSRIFLQGFFRYDGDYKTVPMYIPVSMDTVDADTIWGSFKNLYKQQRRWAWGVEHFPYLLLNFGRNKKITWKMKFKYIWNLGEGMYSWATAPLIIFILGKLPLYMLSKTDESSQVLVQNTPFILEKLLTFAMIGIFASAILSLLLLPPMPEDKQGKNTLRKFGFWMFLPYSTFSLSRRERKIVRSYTIMLFQWMLLPVTLVLFGSIPAIDAQTRLMINKPLGFFNTPKKR